MINHDVGIKPETRNHKGFFINEDTYQLVQVDQTGWALICSSDAVCHYVDPDNLQPMSESELSME